MANPTENKRLDEIAVLRTLAIIGVVLYHAFWGPYFAPQPHLRLAYIPMSSVYESIFHTWFGARMPLFIFISGYLYSYLFNRRGKYVSTPQFVRKKFMRLIVPYVIFTLAMGLTLQNLTLLRFFSGYMHLWFILMIFWCFMLIRIFYRVKRLVPQLLVFGLFSVMYGLVPMPSASGLAFFGLDTALKFFGWFWLGYIIFVNKDKFGVLFKSISIVVLFAIWLGCCLFLQSFPADDRLGFNISIEHNPIVTMSRYLALYVSHIAFIIFSYAAVVKALGSGLIRMKGWIEEVNRCSYGVYIFHLWILCLLLLSTHGTAFHDMLCSWAVNYPVIFPLALFVAMFFPSLFLTRFMLKSRLGKFLLGSA